MTKVVGITPKNAINAKAHRKENKLYHAYKLFDLDTKHELVDLRVYYPAQTCYACVWIRGLKEDQRATGSAKAGGYGYDKMEAAVKSAFIAAGVTLEHQYNAHRPTAILEALAEYWGVKNFHIFEAWG